MPKDELAGRKTSLGLTESFAWNSGEKRRVYDLWKKWQVTQEDYKNVMTLCKEQIRSDKA